jgi:hypothetical protein
MSIIAICFAVSAIGQQVNSSSASQRVVLRLNPIIVVNLDNINARANQQLRVSSNSNFIISSDKAIINKSGYTLLSGSSSNVVLSGKRGVDNVYALNNTKISRNIANGRQVVSTVYTATEL